MTYDEFKKKFKLTRKVHQWPFRLWWDYCGCSTTKPQLKQLGPNGLIIYINNKSKTNQYVINHNGKLEAWYGSNI